MFGQSAAPKNLCILHLSTITDACNAIAVVQNIQKQWPYTQITWVCGKDEADLLRGLDKVELVVFDKSAGWKGFQHLKSNMKGHKFEVLLRMQTGFFENLASYFIPARTKIIFNKKHAIKGQWSFTKTKTPPLQQPHILDEFMQFTHALGVPKAQPTWKMPIPDDDEQWVVDQLAKHIPLATISPISHKSINNWHIENYAKTANYLEKNGFTVVICGGSSIKDQKIAEDICNASHANIINLTNKLSMKQLLGVLKISHIVIAEESEISHMAATVGTPVVGLYAYNNPMRSGPYLYSKYAASYYEDAIKQQYGKASTDLAWGITAKGKDLMQEISVTLVQEKIDSVIQDFYPELVASNTALNTNE